MKPRVYLETSVISYLTARPSRDVVKLAKQELTREWWQTCKRNFSLYVSRPVIEEISAGDPSAARLRVEAVSDLSALVVTAKVNALYRQLLSANIVPEKTPLDALHIAIAAVHGMAYLMTWNCSHINNAVNKQKITKIIERAGYTDVILATPEELWR